MKHPLGVSPSKGNQGTTRGKEKFLLTSVGIEPTTSGLDLPLLCRLSYEVKLSDDSQYFSFSFFFFFCRNRLARIVVSQLMAEIFIPTFFSCDKAYASSRLFISLAS